jgi:glycosyl transferase family 2
MRETPDVVRRFAEYYGAAGADETLVYHDGPLPPELAAIEVPGLVLVACDDGFWSALGGRPDGLEDRQSAAAQAGLARCRSAWLLVCDADEFVFGDMRIPDFLDRIPDSVDAVSVPTAEAVWGPDDDLAAPFGSSYFRVKWRSERLWSGLRRLVYGEVAPHLNRGLAGHISGKEFIRAGKSYSWIRNHSAQRDGVGITRPAAGLSPALAGMYVGHFDAIGLTRWTEKWRRRIERDTLARNMSETRTTQMQFIADRIAAGDGAAHALFRSLYGLTRPQYALLSLLGYAFRRKLFPTDA